jgi:acyl carrier protein
MNEMKTEELITFIRDEVAVVEGEVAPDTDLLLSGLVDSLGVIRITQWIEDELEVDVPPGDVTLENFQTVDRIVSYVATRNAA